MKKRLNYFAGVLAALAIVATTACTSAPTTAQAQYQQAQYQQAAPVAQDPAPQVMAPTDPNLAAQQAGQAVIDPSQYPQPLTAFTCPVAPSALRDVLAGYYGVDGLGRPVNGSHFVVDYYGNCMPAIGGYPLAPVASVYFAPVTYPGYIPYLRLHFGYAYAYNPGFFYHYGPGVPIIHSAPIGRVTVVQNYRAPSTVVVNKTTTTTRTVVNNGTGSRLPGKPGYTPAPPPSAQGSRLPGKTVAAPPPAAAPANTGFKAPNAPAPSTGFKAPAAAPSGGFRAPSAPAPSGGFRAPSAPSGGGFRAPSAPSGGGFRAPSSGGGRRR